MRARVERDALRVAMKRVLPAIQSKGANLPTLSCVRLMVVNPDWLRLVATDLDLTVRTTVEVSNTTEGDAIVPARPLAALLDKAPDGPVELALVDGRLEITAGDSCARLHLHDPKDWPRLPEVPKRLQPLGESILEAIVRVLPAASTDATRPTICTVHIVGDRVEATDSYRAMVARIEGADLAEALLPAFAVGALVKTMDGAVAVSIEERQVTFADERTSWTMRQVEGPFPELKTSLRDTSPHYLTMPTERLAEAVERVQAIGFGRAQIERDGDKARVTVDNADLGRCDDLVPCSGDFDQLVSFNPVFLHDLLDALHEDQVTFELVDDLRPAIVRSGSFTQLLMPVRVPA